jgi:hypothetical protein
MPVYRSLSLPLRGLHILPNQTRGTSHSQASDEWYLHLVRDTPTPTVDAAYGQ